MKFLEAISKIPLPRLMLGTATALIAMWAIEHMPWWRTVGEHILNMGSG